MHTINHNPEYFPSHFAYEPERWLYSGTDPTKQEQLASAKAAHNPFSLGPRGCIAKSLDLTVLELTATTAIWEMDFHVAEARQGEREPGEAWSRIWEGGVDEYQLYRNFTMIKDGRCYSSRGDRQKCFEELSMVRTGALRRIPAFLQDRTQIS